MTDSPAKMTSSQPYLLRALNEWIVDNGFTPQILVDSTHPDLNIPDAVRAGDKVVLNISPSAVRDLEIDNELDVNQMSPSSDALHCSGKEARLGHRHALLKHPKVDQK